MALVETPVGAPDAASDSTTAPVLGTSLDARGPSAPRVPAGWGPIAGVIAGLTGLGLGELAAGVLDRSSPVVSVGNTVIDHVPAPVKRFAISTFGTNDKQALISGILAVTILYAAIVGKIAVRRFRFGVAGIAAFGAVGIWAAVSGRTGTAGNAGPVVVAAGGAIAVLALLIGRSGRPARAFLKPSQPGHEMLAHEGQAQAPQTARTVQSMLPTGRAAGLDRRRFLIGSAGALGAAGVAAAAGKSLQRNGHVVAARAKLAEGFPTAAEPLGPVARTATAPVPGMTPFFTPNAGFYRIDTALAVPRVDPATWRLQLTGMVDRPLSISYADLLARPLVEHDCTLMCVSNEVGGGLIGNARWRGVPLVDLLKEAGVKPGATQIMSESVDGWTSGFPTELAFDGRQALVAVAMNGEALPFKHGFPARLIVPGIYGYVSATKWLTQIRLNRLEDEDGYWIPRGWAKQAPIKTGSRVDRVLNPGNPTGGLVAGTAVIAGVAWAQHRGIEKVEVQVDEGPWLKANLATADTSDTWRQWWIPWTATTGTHHIAVRATDATGATQLEERTDVAPDGATGWHTVSANVH